MATTTPDGDTVPRPVRWFYEALFDDALLKAFWGDAYANCGYWDDGIDSGHAAGDRLVDVSLRGIDAAGVGDVLEVACGHGGATARLASHFPTAAITATGINTEQLAHARQRAPSVQFDAADPVALPYANESFDVLACFEAAFHFDTREQFLAEACRVLRPGGWLVMSDLLLARATQFMPAANYLTGVAAYRRVLDQAGFTRIDVEDITEPGWRSFRRALSRYLIPKAGNPLALRDVLAANSFWAFTIRQNVLVQARRADLPGRHTT